MTLTARHKLSDRRLLAGARLGMLASEQQNPSF